ncbi:N-acetyl-gamma-glutamyl-phosphate reductase [Variovorax sp. WDL1]|nr:N-acetyl-gamma-glutamyl-phosphate reductase [Variovorax sp. WDL1]
MLCLPEAAARAAVASAPKGLRILDASPAHRTAEGWVYGLPELSKDQPGAIRHADRVANPGCYATGAILLLRPFAKELADADYPVSVTAVGGYTSGGKKMIEAFAADPFGYRLYGLDLNHRHVPEIVRFAQLKSTPVFMPAVAGYARGTLVQVPLHLTALGLRLEEVVERLQGAYRLTRVHVDVDTDTRHLDARCTGTNDEDGVFVSVHPSVDSSCLVLSAAFDNLGKGAAGAALNNVLLMLGSSLPFAGTNGRRS